MADHKIDFKEISLYDYESRVEIENDVYNIAKPAFTDSRLKAFSSNPFVEDRSFVTLGLSIVDEKVVGRGMYFPTLFKAGEEILPCLGGSFLEVQADYRHLAVGADIVMNPILHRRSDAIVFAELSDDAIAVYKSMRFKMFTLERMIQPHSSDFILQKMGFKGALLKIFSSVINCILRPTITILNLLAAFPYRKFDVVEVKKVPDWVEELTLNDGHKYMEVHDRKWLQWNLDNMWETNESNSNRFYIVRYRDQNVGFFMLKERICDYSYHNIKNILTGSVVEWGTNDNELLDEKVINMLAIKYFNPKVDVVNIYSDDRKVIRKLRSLLFFKYKPHYIAYRDLTKRFKDAGDRKLWRLRYGYSDSILN